MSDSKPPLLTVVDSAKKPTASKKSRTTSNNGGGGNGQDKPEWSGGEYRIKNGMFYQVKPVRSGGDGGTVEFPLCDFVCEIKQEVIADDGLTDTSFLRIEGRRSNGAPLPLVDVPSKSFFGGQANWANDGWGAAPFIYPGAAKASNLRAVIQLYSQRSGDIPRLTVYKFTGWKKINDHWHYLTGSGAITADGLVDSVQVDIGAGHMGLYTLPAPLSGESLKQAVKEVLKILTVCPGKPHLGASLLAAVFRAPLGECSPTDFAIWLQGLTGSRKSALAAIIQAFFGNFTARSFPANWSDSVNDAEMKSHQVKDGIMVVDDFKPSVSPAEAAKLHAMAERLIRNTGNQAGRGRRDANMQAKAAPFNRSMMIVTAEDLPKGQSLLGRLLILEIGKTDIDNEILTELQRAVQAGLFSGLMATYLQWLAPRLDQ